MSNNLKLGVYRNRKNKANLRKMWKAVTYMCLLVSVLYECVACSLSIS